MNEVELDNDTKELIRLISGMSLSKWNLVQSIVDSTYSKKVSEIEIGDSELTKSFKERASIGPAIRRQFEAD